MVIDTGVENFDSICEKRRKELIEEKKRKGSYDATDIALVRTTDIFPENGEIYSISNVPFVCKINGFLHDIAENKIFDLNNKKNVPDYNESMKIIHEISEKARDYCPWSTQYRSSIHFTLNGLVSSHMQGNFEGRDYIIIEPFKNHEDDENILSVRPDDTFFKDYVALSKDAIILVSEDNIDKLLELNNNKNLKIISYRGDQVKATEYVLLNLGIVPEIIGKDYAIDSPTTQLLYNFIKQKDYTRDKHCFSPSYVEDDRKNLILWEKYAKNFYYFLFEKVYGNVEKHIEEIEWLSKASNFNEKAIKYYSNIIDKIGIEKYKMLIDEYNENINNQIKNGTYPTNNEILEGHKFGVSLADEKTIN